MDPALVFAYVLVTLLSLVNGAAIALLVHTRKHVSAAGETGLEMVVKSESELRKDMAALRKEVFSDIMRTNTKDKELLTAIAAEHNKLASRMHELDEWKAGMALKAASGQQKHGFASSPRASS